MRVEEELVDCDLAQGRPLASHQLNIYDDLGRLSQVIDGQGKRAALGLARTGSTALTMAITVVGRGGHRIEAISPTRLRTIFDHRAK